MLDFSLKLTSGKVKVLFIVTYEYLENPIFGYNLIEHLFVSRDNQKKIDMLMSVFPNILLEGAETMIPILQKVADAPDLLGKVRVPKHTIVPGNRTLRVQCRGNTEFDSKQKSVLFQPLLEPNISDILNNNESHENLSKGKTPHIFITIANLSNRDIAINKGDILGTLHNVSSTIPVIYKKEINFNQISQETELKPSEKWQPIVDLPDLTEEQRKKVHVLRNQCEVFSKDPSDIGNIPDFQMDINLTDSLPVHESYHSIPRKLYDEVKNHIDDLLTNQWIRKSHSAYASPMVYVRKKCGGIRIRLCIDYRKLNNKTIPDKQPIPKMQDILDSLGGQE